MTRMSYIRICPDSFGELAVFDRLSTIGARHLHRMQDIIVQKTDVDPNTKGHLSRGR